MSKSLLDLLSRVARAMESVVPGLSLTPQLGSRVWLEDDSTENAGTAAVDANGQWVTALGFDIGYRDQYSGFENASGGSERERVRSAVLQLMSQVQDIVAEVSAEPWPLVMVNNTRDQALADAAIEANELHMWYGERSAPALKVPTVRLG